MNGLISTKGHKILVNRQVGSVANKLINENLNQSILFNVIEMAKGFHDVPHRHGWHQIIYPLKGMLKAQSGDCQFFIPHHRALFIPANTIHESLILSDTTFVGIYLNPSHDRGSPKECRVIEVSNFFRELILHLKAISNIVDRESASTSRLIDVLYDQLWLERAIEFEIPIPTDRRLAHIVDALLEEPSLDLTLKDWSTQVGASERTLSRLFRKEVNLSYPQWRQRLRLIISLHTLEQDISIQSVALKVGYQSCSAFIEAFKKSFKLTPQQYKKNSHELDFKCSILKGL